MYQRAIKKVKRLYTTEENIQKHVSDKTLASRMYEELLELNNRDTNN